MAAGNHSLNDLYKMYKEGSLGTVQTISPTDFSENAGQGYNVLSLVREKDSNHNKIYNELITNRKIFQQAYANADAIKKAVDDHRRSHEKTEAFYKMVKLGSIEFLVLKRANSTEPIDNDVITPTRLNMIITIAAVYYHVNASKKTDAEMVKEMNWLKSNIVNPLAMFHGFTPEEDVKRRGDVSHRMMFYFLITTPGFDAATFIFPARTAAIALYRCYGRNPDTLGLCNGLDFDKSTLKEGVLNKSLPPELTSRCLQGVYTKQFSYKGNMVKIDDLTSDGDFVKEVGDEFAFLISNARPVRTKAIRTKKVLNILGTNVEEYVKSVKLRHVTEDLLTASTSQIKKSRPVSKREEAKHDDIDSLAKKLRDLKERQRNRELQQKKSTASKPIVKKQTLTRTKSHTEGAAGGLGLPGLDDMQTPRQKPKKDTQVKAARPVEPTDILGMDASDMAGYMASPTGDDPNDATQRKLAELIEVTAELAPPMSEEDATKMCTEAWGDFLKVANDTNAFASRQELTDFMVQSGLLEDYRKIKERMDLPNIADEITDWSEKAHSILKNYVTDVVQRETENAELEDLERKIEGGIGELEQRREDLNIEDEYDTEEEQYEEGDIPEENEEE